MADPSIAKSSQAVPRSYDDGRVRIIGRRAQGHEVGVSVAIEIDGRDTGRANSVEHESRLQAAGSVAEPHRTWIAVAHRRHVQRSIFVEIRRGEPRGGRVVDVVR